MTQVALSNVYPNLWFEKVPEAGRFASAGLLGNVVFFIIDYVFFNNIILPLANDLPKIVQRNKETVSFFVSYLMQTGFQHFLNALLVYGLDTIGTKKKYFDSLIITYSSYSMSLIGSTIGNALLIKHGVPRNIAFWGTILSFGVVNFFLLKFLVGNSDNKNELHHDCVAEEDGDVRNGKNIISEIKGIVRNMRGGQKPIFKGSAINPLLPAFIGSTTDHFTPEITF